MSSFYIKGVETFKLFRNISGETLVCDTGRIGCFSHSHIITNRKECVGGFVNVFCTYFIKKVL